jgi:hypothetical protein
MAREKIVDVGKALYEKIVELMYGSEFEEYDDGDALVAEKRHRGMVTKVFRDHETGRVKVYSQDPWFMGKIAQMAEELQMQYIEFTAEF